MHALRAHPYFDSRYTITTNLVAYSRNDRLKKHRLSLVFVGHRWLIADADLAWEPMTLWLPEKKDRRGPTSTDVFFVLSFRLLVIQGIPRLDLWRLKYFDAYLFISRSGLEPHHHRLIVKKNSFSSSCLFITSTGGAWGTRSASSSYPWIRRACSCRRERERARFTQLRIKSVVP